MPHTGRLIAVIVACLAAAPSAAQTPKGAGGMFVDAFVSPDWDDAANQITNVPGATWRSGLAFGFDAGRSGFEFGVGVPQWHTLNRTSRYEYAGPAHGAFQQFHDYELSQTVRRRSVDVTAVYRANMPVNQHVAFTWIAGLGIVFRPEQVIDVTNEVSPGGELSEVDARQKISSITKLASRGSMSNFESHDAYPSCRGCAPRFFLRSSTTADRTS